MLSRILIGLGALAVQIPAIQVQAQEAAASPAWTITTTVRTGDAPTVTCALAFPSQSGLPTIRVLGTGRAAAPAPVSFELRRAGTYPAEAVEGISLNVGSVSQSDLSGTWAEGGNGTLTFAANGEAAPLLAAIGQAKELTIVSGDNTYTYPLDGSYGAMWEFKACLG